MQNIVYRIWIDYYILIIGNIGYSQIIHHYCRNRICYNGIIKIKINTGLAQYYISYLYILSGFNFIGYKTVTGEFIRIGIGQVDIFKNKFHLVAIRYFYTVVMARVYGLKRVPIEL